MGVEVHLHPFLISRLGEVIGQLNAQVAFRAGENFPVMHCVGVGRPVGTYFGAIRRRDGFLPSRESKLWSLGRLGRIVITD